MMDKKSIREMFGWLPPGQGPSYRKIVADGEEYLQIAMPMGGFSAHACIPLTGRPDMSRPHEHATFLEFLKRRLAAYVQEHGTDVGFALSEDDLDEAGEEILDFYRRRRFLLEVAAAAALFNTVIRDGQHTLALMDMIDKYSLDRERAWAHRKYEPYIRCHMVQARVLMALQAEDYAGIARAVQQGIGLLDEFAREHELPEYDDLDESIYPHALIEHLTKMGVELLQGGQEQAIQEENYEGAAVIRDLIAQLEQAKQG